MGTHSLISAQNLDINYRYHDLQSLFKKKNVSRAANQH